MDDKLVKVDYKLHGKEQWQMWKFKIRILMNASDVFDVVDGSLPRPEVTSSNYESNIKEWKKKDMSAQNIISATVGQQPTLHIINCKSACEMWNKLNSVYEQKSNTSVHFLQQRFYSYVKDANDNMAVHIAKLEEIAQQLNDLGEGISDSMLMTKILMTLPNNYNHFHSAWESTAENERTAENLRTRLMIEESRISSQEPVESSEALLAKKSSQRQSKNNSKKSKGKSKCFHCHETGHWKKDCPKQKSSNEKGESQAFSCELSKSISDSDAWFLDSGASDHMSNKFEWFTEYEKYSSPKMIRVGNGELIPAYGKGNIHILAYDGRRWIRRHLSDVLYVPAIHLNLFSMSRILEKGFTLTSDESKCEFKSNGNIVAVGERQVRLYKMFFKFLVSSEGDASAHTALKKESLKKWHERLCHQNVAHVKHFLRNNNIDYIDEQFVCEACIYGKHHRSSFSSREEKSSECGQIIHADLSGAIEPESIGGSKYYVIFKDDFSHYRHVRFMKNKSDVFEHFKHFVKMIDTQHDFRVRIFRSDNGTEFCNQNMANFMKERGIVHHRTIPYTPEQNGSAEREMRTIGEAARTLIHSRSLNKALWAEAVNTAVYVLNATGTSTIVGKTPYELWHHKKANIEHLKAFGVDVYKHIPKQLRRKLDCKAAKCVFVGYGENVKGFRLWNPATNKVEFSRDVFFDENFIENEIIVNVNSGDKGDESEKTTATANESDDSSKAANDTENSSNATEVNSNDVSRNSIDTSVIDLSSSIDEEFNDCDDGMQNNMRGWCDVTTSNIMNRPRLYRQNASTDFCCESDALAFMATFDEPATFQEATNSKQKKQWVAAMNEEIESLLKNRTWSLVDLPSGKKVIDNRWVFKIKTNTDGSVDRYKARLVIRGFTQEHGVDYSETFSPVVKFTSIRTILAIAAQRKLKLKQFDVKTAFLYGDLEEDVYMTQPIGYNDGSGKVCKLIKSLYGLKQASRCWNKKFTMFIKQFDFIVSTSDPCVFIHSKNGITIILAIYVDDGLMAASNEKCMTPVIDFLNEHFEIKTFDAKCFLGLEINQRPDGAIYIHQSAYSRKILNRFRMIDSNTVAVPADPSQTLCTVDIRDECNFPYREAIGSLMYLAIATRPDISYAIGNCSRFMENPAPVHVNAVKRILKYINGTLNFGLFYINDSEFYLRGFSDADYAGDVDNRRSTSGCLFLLGTCVISWFSTKQRSVTLSTTESEYVAAAEAVKELIWLKRLLSEIAPDIEQIPRFYMDNQSAIKIVKNPEFHKRTKHIEVRYHFIREKYERKEFLLEYVSSNEQLADVFTKALARNKFEFFRNKMNIVNSNTT